MFKNKIKKGVSLSWKNYFPPFLIKESNVECENTLP